MAPPFEVTVVIPSYGGAATISRAVTSALEQNGGSVCVKVVIDDGCGTTHARVESMKDDRVQILTNERSLGAPASRNRGLALTTTPYVAFLDADDYYEGNLLAPLIAEMKKQDAGIGFGPSVRWSPGAGFARRRLPNYADSAHVFSEWLGKRRNVNTASVVWSTAYLRSIGAWDPAILRNQDGEIALRAILMGARFATSGSGAGVWTDDRSLARITTRSDNLGSLLSIVDKFLAIEPSAVPDAIRRRVCARYCLTIAHLAFASGQDEVGRKALQRRRDLGRTAYSGNILYASSASLRIIPKRERLYLWSALRKLRALFAAFVARIMPAG